MAAALHAVVGAVRPGNTAMGAGPISSVGWSHPINPRATEIELKAYATLADVPTIACDFRHHTA